MSRDKEYRREDGFEPVDLLVYGRDHLLAANILSREGMQFLDSAVVLAHLSIELLLKAHLLQLTGAFPNTHSLDDLLALLRKAGAVCELSSRENATMDLLGLLGGARYPSPTAPHRVGTQDVPAVRALWERLLSELPDRLAGELAVHPHNLKGGRIAMIRQGDPEL
jgi:HEPN domain-containing protein